VRSVSRQAVALLVTVLALITTTDGSGQALPSDDALSHWPEISHLRDGSTVAVWEDGRVIERDRAGRVLSDSTFESEAIYERWVKFMRSFQTAVEEGDRSSVASSIEYPLSLSHGIIPNRQELLRRYGAVFTPGVVAEIESADPRALFCQNVSQVMLDSGVVWGDDFKGRLAVITINPPMP
jgi:hypothetical protein